MIAMTRAAMRIGATDYRDGKPLTSNPYIVGSWPARAYADAWLAAWLGGGA